MDAPTTTAPMDAKAAPPAPFLNKRRFWLCLALVFFCGLLCGGIGAVLGLRYVRTHFAPPVDRVSKKIASRIARDFKLDAEKRTFVEQELRRLGGEIGDRMRESGELIEASIDRLGQNIAPVIPDETARKRWEKEYRNYFPRFPIVPPRE